MFNNGAKKIRCGYLEGVPADLHAWKGHPLESLAQSNPANMMKYGMGAMQKYETAGGGLAGPIKLESARDTEDNRVSEKWKERKSPWPKA